jgi:FAD dependent oxidoreductase
MMTDAQRREKARLRSERWRRAHGIMAAIGAWLGIGGGVTSRGERRMEDFASVVATYRVAGTSLYIVGTFDTGVTAFSQQIRALNLVWALIESEMIPSIRSTTGTVVNLLKVAIVGGGFAGLSVAAGLIKKGANARITIFEERDTLLPLQQGCDSRWLHPHIYDWPGERSGGIYMPARWWRCALGRFSLL